MGDQTPRGEDRQEIRQLGMKALLFIIIMAMLILLMSCGESTPRFTHTDLNGKWTLERVEIQLNDTYFIITDCTGLLINFPELPWMDLDFQNPTTLSVELPCYNVTIPARWVLRGQTLTIVSGSDISGRVTPEGDAFSVKFDLPFDPIYFYTR
jgi:hypothetical protein